MKRFVSQKSVLKKLIALSIALVIFFCAFANAEEKTKPNSQNQGLKQGLPTLLPRELEIELARSAAPKHLQADATVYVLERGGYVIAKEGTNGFTCFVDRFTPTGVHPGVFIPICYDRIGTKTVLPKLLERARLYESGLSNEQVEAEINEGFRSGKYQSVPRTGVAYMWSPFFTFSNGKGLRELNLPHTMIYGPFVTNEDLGSPGQQLTGVPFMVNPGPHGDIIFPLGEKEREAIKADYAPMIQRMEKYIAHLRNKK